MALHYLIFIFLIVLAAVFFILSHTRESLGAGFAFIAASGAITFLAGLLLQVEGLQLPTLEQINPLGEGYVLVHQTLTFSGSFAIQILSSLLLGGGFVIVLVGIVIAVSKRRAESAERY